MLTQNEVSVLNLSPTKKDFVQIWNELLEVSGKLSERWDPTSTNESDPGIVILKALTGIADKLNYNIDKNTLEAFMPTAAQEDSMRKLCDMLGYNIKYYQSASTEVNIKYKNQDETDDQRNALRGSDVTGAIGLLIPKFTVVTNGDKDISYFTLYPARISEKSPSAKVLCMEGQIVQCESINENNIITVRQVSENNRFYLPETYIAENGIFIYNANKLDELNTSLEETSWRKVDNLNTQLPGEKVYKFGFDSYRSRPYIEFPNDYSSLFDEGIVIYYTRTNGINGNISARTLTQLELPRGDEWSSFSTDNFVVENTFAANQGCGIETIAQAYKNFTKTIGTFDTLVTCRDYMNKIYSMVDSANKPYISNILVTDLHSDINSSTTLCSFDGAGIFYKDMPKSSRVELWSAETENTTLSFVLDNKPVFDAATSTWFVTNTELTSEYFLNATAAEEEFIFTQDGTVKASRNNITGKYYWTIRQASTDFTTKFEVAIDESTNTSTTKLLQDKPLLDKFDLVFYPFKSYVQNKATLDAIKTGYNASFELDNKITLKKITDAIDESGNKLVIHNIKYPNIGDIVSITNYLKLNATVVTNNRLTDIEAESLIHNVKIALATAFNMRELDFGASIPFERIMEVIENADSRIRAISLNDPALYTTFTKLENYVDNTPVLGEYAVASKWLTDKDTSALSKVKENFNTREAWDIYNKLAIRNILAGRVPLFKYNNVFEADFGESPYQVTTELELPFLDDFDDASGILPPGFFDDPQVTSMLPKEFLEMLKPASEETGGAADGSGSGDAGDNSGSGTGGNSGAGDNSGSGAGSTGNGAGPGSGTGSNGGSDNSRLGLCEENPYIIFTTEEPVRTTTGVAEAVAALDMAAAMLGAGTESGVSGAGDSSAPATTSVSAGGSGGGLSRYTHPVTYTAQYKGKGNKPLFTKTCVPSSLADKINNNTITYIDTNKPITSIEADCTITPYSDVNAEATPDAVVADASTTASAATGTGTATGYNQRYSSFEHEAGVINNVRLGAGETVRFKTPNFTTIKTYPAYVNYHLELTNTTQTEAVPAEVISLYDLIDSDEANWANLHYSFGLVDDRSSDAAYKYKKTVTRALRVTPAASLAKVTPADQLKEELDIVEVSSTEELRNLLLSSGRLRLASIRTAWTPRSGEVKPASSAPNYNPLTALGNATKILVTEDADIAAIESYIENDLVEQYQKGGGPGNGSNCTWTIYLDYEGVPLNKNSLSLWEAYIRTCAHTEKDNPASIFYRARQVDDKYNFTPQEEGNVIFWRIYGAGYTPGRYVLASNQKLLGFKAMHFGLLEQDQNVLRNVYLAKTLGNDSNNRSILNDTEYALREHEHLFIEYTPSTTAEDGSTMTLPAKTEVYGAGTIIRPSGFASGLKATSDTDSSTYKTVNFAVTNQDGTTSTRRVGLLSLGASEQIEIRDFSRVVLDKNSFNNRDKVLYVYKNFNCDALDNPAIGGISSYTLKDGEAIFYTDQDKNEFAYFTNGTKVTLYYTRLPKTTKVIDLNTLYEGGPDVIPWSKLALTGDKKIEFQEFQYLTLSEGDTIVSIKLLGGHSLNRNWQYCDKEAGNTNVLYMRAGSDEPLPLPAVDIFGQGTSGTNKGCGWEVASEFILNVSSGTSQTVHASEVANYTGLGYSSQAGAAVSTTNTGIRLVSSDALTGNKTISLSPEEFLEGMQSGANTSGSDGDGAFAPKPPALSFKTNLPCYVGDSSVDISNKLFNPDGVNGFEFKIFKSEVPAIIKTARDNNTPSKDELVDGNFRDINDWVGTPIIGNSTIDDWTEIPLSDISQKETYDDALMLSVSLIPDTYGLFSLYVNPNNSADASVWVSSLFGIKPSDISLINRTDIENQGLKETETITVGVDTTTYLKKLNLAPGMNCIKVNKSCKLFIKASEGAEGSVFFDKLRLVQTKKYIDNGTECDSLGLNLDQIGYALPYGIDHITPDEDIKARIGQYLLENASFTLNNFVDESVAKFKDLHRQYWPIKNKLNKLIAAERSIRDALGAIIDEANTTAGTAGERFVQLRNMFVQLTEAIEREKALLEVLSTENLPNEAIEQQIVSTFVKDFSDIDATRVQLLEEVEQLANTTLVGLNNIDNESIIKDFLECEDSSSYKSDAIDKIKSVAGDRININLQQKLASLVTELKQRVLSDDYSALYNAIESVYTNVKAQEMADFTSALQDLDRYPSVSEITLIIENAVAAFGVGFDQNETNEARVNGYKELIKYLTDLLAVFENIAGKEALVQEISDATKAGDTALVAELLTKLSIDPENERLTNILDSIRVLYSHAQASVIANKPGANKTSVLEAGRVLKTDAKDYLEELLENGIERVQDAFNAFESVYALTKFIDSTVVSDAQEDLANALSSLRAIKSHQDSQFLYVVKQIEAAVEKHALDIESLDSIRNYKSTSAADIIEESIVEIWPDFIIRRAAFVINKIKLGLSQLLSSEVDVNTTDMINSSAQIDSLINNNLTTAIKNNINVVAFKALFRQICIWTSRRANARMDASMLKTLSTLLPESANLTAALSEVSTAQTATNAVVNRLITELTSPDLSLLQKQPILNNLRDELTTSITANTELLNIVIYAICPELKLTNVEFIQDSFYSKLTYLVKDTMESLISNNYSTESLETVHSKFIKVHHTDSNILTILDTCKEDFSGVTTEREILYMLRGMTNISGMPEYVTTYDFETLLPTINSKVVADFCTWAAEGDTIQAALPSIEDYLDAFSTQGASIPTIAELELLFTSILSSLSEDSDSVSTVRTCIEEIVTTIDQLKNDSDKVIPIYVEKLSLRDTELNLLSILRSFDTERDFYYNVPINNTYCIDIPDSTENNVLLNPLAFYDINNINNGFVISKIDMDYLTNGIKIATTSRY